MCRYVHTKRTLKLLLENRKVLFTTRQEREGKWR